MLIKHTRVFLTSRQASTHLIILAHEHLLVAKLSDQAPDCVLQLPDHSDRLSCDTVLDTGKTMLLVKPQGEGVDQPAVPKSCLYGFQKGLVLGVGELFGEMVFAFEKRELELFVCC